MKPFSLVVALKDSGNTGRGHTADGELFWDDGVSIGNTKTSMRPLTGKCTLRHMQTM